MREESADVAISSADGVRAGSSGGASLEAFKDCSDRDMAFDGGVASRTTDLSWRTTSSSAPPIASFSVANAGLIIEGLMVDSSAARSLLLFHQPFKLSNSLSRAHTKSTPPPR